VIAIKTAVSTKSRSYWARLSIAPLSSAPTAIATIQKVQIVARAVSRHPNTHGLEGPEGRITIVPSVDENRHKTNTYTGLSMHMVLQNLKIGIGIVALLVGMPILISPIGVVGHFSSVIGRVGIGLILVIGGAWAVWMNW
jgi:hypothetical protein